MLFFKQIYTCGMTVCTLFQANLYAFNDKKAQFRIMPRYKVKAEGDIVSFVFSLQCFVLGMIISIFHVFFIGIRYLYMCTLSKCLSKKSN